jgi:mono/diheme cytochrome c family protein
LAEVPDYLLQRSRERRAALGAGGAGGGPTPSSGDTGGSEAAPAAATESPAVPEAAPPAVEAALPAVIEEAPPPPLPTSRTGIPGWMLPVLVALPFWAIVYMGAFGTVKSGAAPTGAALGAKVYTTNCAPCHGGRGEGGVGPKLAGGEAALTFPNEADHIAWVETGSGPHKGQPYGDPARPGSQHVAKSGGMPAFKGQLKDDEIKQVVTYERTGLQ